MKLVLKNTAGISNARLNIVRKEVPCLDASWHYHAQYELIYLPQSSGIRFVGDNVSQFEPGDLVLIGPYLPHLWRNDIAASTAENPPKINTIIIKFTDDFIGTNTFAYPEFAGIQQLLEQSKFGISFGKCTRKKLHQLLCNIVNFSAAEQSIRLLGLLHQLSKSNDQQQLSTTDMRQYASEHSQRIDAVIKFISDNYANYISLEDVAEVACLTPNSFCRFFKKMTNKSFVRFLNEVRIRNASRLLVQQNLQVSDICYMVGYQSITNFNRQFKQIMGMTPISYRQSV
ncbi:MAG: AraC family transcriptional regulator [Bacteroidetes bacterium]|nr:MAG: AraC family transcriptional regulator [Bacteroidota bacterium]